MSDLAMHIQQTPLSDTHEHLRNERDFIDNPPDVLQNLFDNYVIDDLVVAGASIEAVQALINPDSTDIAERWVGVAHYWQYVQYTGYGRAVQWVAEHIYGITQLTPSAMEATTDALKARQQSGERLRILRDEANLSHVQTDNFTWECLPDASGLDFFFYDLSWLSYANGHIDPVAIHEAVAVDVHDVPTLKQAMQALFAKYAPVAIAVKTQHAYDRTLHWSARDESDVASLLQKSLQGTPLTPIEQQCLGDWCLGFGVELAIEYQLPIKIHTGYYAGHSRMPLDWIRPSNLDALLRAYPQARFVLMHLAYPYLDELIALAKHYPNVYVDFCWAWSINPYSASQALRQLLHSVPINKLFIFGGDSDFPDIVRAYATQTRDWLTRTLQAEIDDQHLSEQQTISIATRLMHNNQHDCFDIDGTRLAIHKSKSTTDR